MNAVCEPEAANQVDTPGKIAQAILTGQSNMSAKLLTSPARIALTGFMGAGKSTVGRLLAERLGWRFIDVDEEIVRKAGMPVSEVFAKYGEFVFRRMETSAIAHALGERDAVIALGGGAVEVLANRLLLEQTPRTAVIFLDAPLPVLLARCDDQAGAPHRPNLAVAEERFRYRAPLYRRVCHLRLDTADQTAEETVNLLAAQLRSSAGSRT